MGRNAHRLPDLASGRPHRAMLLWVVKVLRVRGQTSDGPLGVEGELLSGHALPVMRLGGRAGRSFEGQPGRRQAVIGPSPPLQISGAREVPVDLAGDVAFEHAGD